ncbi:tRNA (adenosine(37)-N6)-threonylcarbamoyltransferase complex transferase subunit TsaD [Deferribacter abyssi]|uniref:tRNA (adenosine(37)-N6)-threonylcarbamoyltransferase complex transferase subunit TsaD n=1 Tax=Deferribacter abyssi TaxID=213806 RepID=UPI003C29C057
MLVLGIETSCDETSMAIYDSKKGIKGSIISSQINLHKKFGGVVPEIASRNHLLKLEDIFLTLLNDTKIDKKDIDLIGVTNTPGLIGSLFVGVAFAKGLAYGLKKPLVPVNHLAAHTLSCEIENPTLKPPYLSFIISGGHTHIYKVDKAYNFYLLSHTVDDAVGECYDKVAKMMNLPYPGGPEIEKLALKGDEYKIKFPVALKNSTNFSFSGLKTAVLNVLEKKEYLLEDIAASFQFAIFNNFINKLDKIIYKSKIKKILISGGVSANSYLRNKLSTYYSTKGIKLFFPSKRLCTDNGDMIAYTAYKFFNKRKFMGVKETAYDVMPYITN